jgi:hypothetical protein
MGIIKKEKRPNILGFIKLLQGYYMLAVTEAECVAKIGCKRLLNSIN